LKHSPKKDSKAVLMLVMISCVTLLMLVAGAASSISGSYQYVYAVKSLTPSKGGSGGDSSSNNSTTPIGSKTFLTVSTKVVGDTSNPSDFTISVAGNSPSPKSFHGSSSGTSVTLDAGKYKVTASGKPGYSTSYSSGCSGTASGGQVKCTITNRYSAPPPGATTFLSVITKVDNTNGGTKKPSDFTISVYGNSPSPKSFSGSSSGTSVKLMSGSYKVTTSSIPDYKTSYSSSCSGTASGGVPIKCTITNQYNGPSPSPSPSPPIKPSGLTITSESKSVYSIPSTFVKVDRFGINYTIVGNASTINSSRNLISSTIINDFDMNPNIGYVLSNSSSSASAQPGLPNPFVGKDVINQKITNETQSAISAATANIAPGENVEIKCTFGLILADYQCS
jgi:prealbumin domain-containing protein